MMFQECNACKLIYNIWNWITTLSVSILSVYSDVVVPFSFCIRNNSLSSENIWHYRKEPRNNSKIALKSSNVLTILSYGIGRTFVRAMLRRRWRTPICKYIDMLILKKGYHSFCGDMGRRCLYIFLAYSHLFVIGRTVYTKPVLTGRRERP